MAEPNTHHLFPAPVKNAPIINPHFCAPYTVDLLIFRRVREMQHGDFVVTDINTNVRLKLKDESHHFLNSRRVLLDAADNPIITLKPKNYSMHDRWEVFKGESTDTTDLLFTVKRSSIAMFQRKTKLDVFLANNTEQKVSDFKVKGSWKERPCLFYAGEFSSVVAQMHKKAKVENVFLRGKSMVTVFPDHDYGFIVALTIILAAINEQTAETGGDYDGWDDVVSGIVDGVIDGGVCGGGGCGGGCGGGGGGCGGGGGGGGCGGGGGGGGCGGGGGGVG